MQNALEQEKLDKQRADLERDRADLQKQLAQRGTRRAMGDRLLILAQLLAGIVLIMFGAFVAVTFPEAGHGRYSNHWRRLGASPRKGSGRGEHSP